MTNATKTLNEIMDAYNAAREQFEAKQGDGFNEAEFHAWFTQQVAG